MEDLPGSFSGRPPDRSGALTQGLLAHALTAHCLFMQVMSTVLSTSALTASPLTMPDTAPLHASSMPPLSTSKLCQRQLHSTTARKQEISFYDRLFLLVHDCSHPAGTHPRTWHVASPPLADEAEHDTRVHLGMALDSETRAKPSHCSMASSTSNQQSEQQKQLQALHEELCAALAGLENQHASQAQRAIVHRLGVQAPMGFWDPLGLSADGDVENFARHKNIEIKRGLSIVFAALEDVTPDQHRKALPLMRSRTRWKPFPRCLLRDGAKMLHTVFSMELTVSATGVMRPEVSTSRSSPVLILKRGRGTTQ